MPKIELQPLKGLNSLSDQERKDWVNQQISLGKLPSHWKYAQADRLYKNQQFVDRFGMDTFRSMSARDRDEYYDHDVYGQAISTKYEGDPNLDTFMALSTEGMKDLWDSGIRTSSEIQGEIDRLEAMRIDPLKEIERQEETAKNIDNWFVRGLYRTQNMGFSQYGGDPATRAQVTNSMVDKSIADLQQEETKKRESLIQREHDRIVNSPEVTAMSNQMRQNIYRSVDAGQLTLQQIDDDFEAVFGRQEGDAVWSRYYEAYKDERELRDFDTDAKIDFLTKFYSIAAQRGEAAALSTMDTQLQHTIFNNQSGWRALWLNTRQIPAKTAGYLGNIYMGVDNIFKQIKYSGGDTEEEKAENARKYNLYLEGKDEDGSTLPWYKNPRYWEGVDQFSVWSPSEINRIRENGGISPMVAAIDAGGDFSLGQSAGEMWKMTGYMIPGIIITALTRGRNLPTLVSGTIAATEIGGGALSLAQAYSLGAYDQTLQTAREQNDAAIGQLAKEYADNFMVGIDVSGMTDKEVQETYAGAYQQFLDDNEELVNDLESHALQSAKAAAATDFAIEAVRMGVIQSTLGKWTKSKATRDFLNRGYNKVVADGTYGLTQATSRGLARTKAVAGTLFSGAESNYFDDVTVGFGKGFGLNSHNDYLAWRFDPEGYAAGTEFIDNTIDNIYGGINGAINAMGEVQSWRDALIGAGGSVVGFTPHFSAFFNAKKNWNANPYRAIDGTAYASPTTLERLNRFVNNGILNSLADADARYNRTSQAIAMTNKVIEDHQEDLEQFASVLKSFNDFELVADNVLAGRDAKQKGLFQLATMLNRPDLLQSQVTAVQQIQETLERYAKGEFTEEEIQSFMAESSNKSFLDKAGNPADPTQEGTRRQAAVEQMQKNAKNIQEYFKTYKDVSDKVNKGKFTGFSEDLKMELTFQLMMLDSWQKDLDSMESSLKGSSSTSNRFTPEAMGNQANLNASIREINSEISKNQASMEALQRQLDGLKRRQDSNPLEISSLQAQINAFKERNKILKARVRTYQNGLTSFNEDGYSRTLSAEEILNLNPEQREYMLSEEHRAEFSPEQQQVIEEVLRELRADPEGMKEGYIADTAEKYRRVRDTREAYDRLVKNPALAEDYINAFKGNLAEARARAYIDYIKGNMFAQLDNAFTPAVAPEQLTTTVNQRVRDLVFSGRGIPMEFLTEYAEKNPEKAAIIQDIIDLARYWDDTITTVKSLSDVQAERVAILTTIKGILYQSENVADLVQKLEDMVDAELDNEAGKQMQARVNDVLDKMQDLNHLRDANKVKSREDKRLAKIAEEEAKLKEKSEHGENFDWDGYNKGDVVYNTADSQEGVVDTFMTDDGGNNMMVVVNPKDQTVKMYNSKFDKDLISKTKPEPSKEVKEEVKQETITLSDKPVVLEADAPITDDVVINSEGQATVVEQPETHATEEVGQQTYEDAVDIAEEQPTSQSVMQGNKLTQYDFYRLRDFQTQEAWKPSSESVVKYFEWLDNNGIKLQEIIDNEVGKIFQKHPDTPVRIMKIKGDGLNAHNVLVVEATPQIEAIHDKSRGEYINAQGKRWLPIGTLGYQANTAQEASYKYFTSKANSNSRRFFTDNPTEQYYVEQGSYTNIADMTSGFITRKLIGDSEVKTRSLGELLNDHVRNPQGLSFKNLKWYIQKGENGKKIGLTESDHFYPPRDIAGNNGNVFIALQAANGNYIPLAIKPTTYNELKLGSQLKDIIDGHLDEIYSPNYATRVNAIKELVKLLNLTEEDNILIGREGVNTVTIKQGGVAVKTFNVETEPDRREEFFEAVRNAAFRVNITEATLNNPTRLRIYDEAGALTTEAAKLGVSGSTFSVYPVGSNGAPLVDTPARVSNPNRNRSSLAERVPSAIIAGTTFRKKGGRWVDSSDNVVDPSNQALIKELEYNITVLNMTPVTKANGKDYFIISNDPSSPIVVSRDSRGHIIETTSANTPIAKINEFIKKAVEGNLSSQRSQNIQHEEVVFTQPAQELVAPTAVNDEIIAKQSVGDFSETAETPAQAAPVEAPVNSAETDVNKFVNKSLNSLQESGKIHNFAEIYRNKESRATLLSIAKEKGWDLGGTLGSAKALLESKGVSLANIENVELWLQMIKDCK